MHGFSTSIGHGQAHNPVHGQDMDMSDAHVPEASVTNLIAQFETRSTKPPKPAKPSHIAAFNRASNALRVTSPTGEQFTSSSLRVRSGSIGRPPPVRFGSMGHQSHSGMRMTSPTVGQSTDAYGGRAASRNNSRSVATPSSPFPTIASSMNMSSQGHAQPNALGAVHQMDGAQNETFFGGGAMSTSSGNLDGGQPSPFGFANGGNRMVRSMQGHIMDTFGMVSPMAGTPTSPFGNIDYSAPSVVSPIQSPAIDPSIDPYGDIGALANLGSNGGASQFDSMSSVDRVHSPMQQTTAMGAFQLGLDSKPTAQFGNTPTDAFQSLDPFQAMSSVAANHHHGQVSFVDMAANSSSDPFADLGLLIKQESNMESGHFDAGNLSPRSAGGAIHSPLHFANQGYFQPPALQSHSQLQKQRQQHPQQQATPLHQQQQHQQHGQAQPPPPPAKKPFLSRNQQDIAGNQSTPGFSMWRPPVPSTPKPLVSHSQQPSSGSISSATPNKSAAFLAQSRAELRIQTDNAPSLSQQQQQQTFNGTLSVASPTSRLVTPSMDSAVRSPSVASPVNIILEAFWLIFRMLINDGLEPASSSRTAEPAGVATVQGTGPRRSMGVYENDNSTVVSRGAETAKGSHPGDGGSARLPSDV